MIVAAIVPAVIPVTSKRFLFARILEDTLAATSKALGVLTACNGNPLNLRQQVVIVKTVRVEAPKEVLGGVTQETDVAELVGGSIGEAGLVGIGDVVVRFGTVVNVDEFSQPAIVDLCLEADINLALHLSLGVLQVFVGGCVGISIFGNRVLGRRILFSCNGVSSTAKLCETDMQAHTMVAEALGFQVSRNDRLFLCHRVSLLGCHELVHKELEQAGVLQRVPFIPELDQGSVVNGDLAVFIVLGALEDEKHLAFQCVIQKSCLHMIAENVLNNQGGLLHLPVGMKQLCFLDITGRSHDGFGMNALFGEL